MSTDVSEVPAAYIIIALNGLVQEVTGRLVLGISLL
jgi:hypothetical protein